MGGTYGHEFILEPCHEGCTVPYRDIIAREGIGPFSFAVQGLQERIVDADLIHHALYRIGRHIVIRADPWSVRSPPAGMVDGMIGQFMAVFRYCLPIPEPVPEGRGIGGNVKGPLEP